MSEKTDFIPDSEFVADEGVEATPAAPQITSQTNLDFIPDSEFKSDEDANAQAEKALQKSYGTPSQQLKAGLEGAARGVLGSSITSGLELAGGVRPESIRGREAANPITAGVAEAGTFLGSALMGAGEAGVLTKAGQALEAAGALPKGGRLATAGAEAAKAAFEGILYQSDKELHRVFTEDPAQTADSVVANYGMTTVLSGLFGGAAGLAFSKAAPEAVQAGNFISEVDRPLIEAGDLSANIKASDIKPSLKDQVLNAIKLGEEKAEAPAIKSAAKELGAPVLPGMTLESPLVQTQLDALIHSRYTVAGSRVGGKFDEAYMAAAGALDEAVSAGAVPSKADLGKQLKETLTGKIRKEYEPIQQVYDELSATHSIIPVEEATSSALVKELSEIPEFRVSPSSPGGQLVRQVLKDIDNVKTLSDLKIVRDGLSLSSTASSQERRMVGILKDKLSEIEEGAVERFAKGFPKNDEAGTYVQSLVDAKREVTPVYKKFIGKVSELSDQLGKGKIHGTEDALRFLNDGLTAEQVASKVFAKNDSEFLTFFSKNFPEEFQTVRNFQRAEMIEKATRGDQGFGPKAFFTNFNKLEPEIQQKLYSGSEIKKITAAETYIREAFPKNFNPSGTAHMAALREAYETPKSFAYANVRDYAIEKAIQVASGSAEGKQAVALAQATIKGENTANKAVKAIFDKANQMPASIVPMAASRARLDRLVTKAAEDPERLVAMNDNNKSIPEYNGPLAASAARVVSYLAQLKPKTGGANPLDGERMPSTVEKSAYNRALDIAEQPLVVLSNLKTGRITPQDITSLKTMYPNLYNKLSTKINAQIIDKVNKGQVIPYSTRMGLSIFLGRPLDSTFTPSGIINAQPMPPSPEAADTVKGYQTKGLNKLPNQYRTPSQSRQDRDQKP